MMLRLVSSSSGCPIAAISFSCGLPTVTSRYVGDGHRGLMIIVIFPWRRVGIRMFFPGGRISLLGTLV